MERTFHSLSSLSRGSDLHFPFLRSSHRKLQPALSSTHSTYSLLNYAWTRSKQPAFANRDLRALIGTRSAGAVPLRRCRWRTSPARFSNASLATKTLPIRRRGLPEFRRIGVFLIS